MTSRLTPCDPSSRRERIVHALRNDPISPSAVLGLLFVVLVSQQAVADVVKPTCRRRPPAETPGFFSQLASRIGTPIPPDRRPFGKSVAFLIAVESYKYLPTLDGNRRSTETLAKYLYETEGFDEVCTIFDGNAQREFVEDFILNDLKPRLTPNDRFLFFFAGHGANASAGSTGYMLLADARKNDFVHSVIPTVMIREWSGQLSVAHALFVLDSCSSGFGAEVISMGDRDSSPDEKILAVFSGSHSRVLWTAATAEESTYFDAQKGAPIFTDCWRQSLASLTGDGPLRGLHTSEEVFAAAKACVIKWVATVCRQTDPDCHLTPQQPPIGGPRGQGDFLFLGPRADVGTELLHKLGISHSGPQAQVSRESLDFFYEGTRQAGAHLALADALIAKGTPFSARVTVRNVTDVPLFVSVESRSPVSVNWDGGTGRARLQPAAEATAVVRTEALSEPLNREIQFKVAPTEDGLAVAPAGSVVDVALGIDVQEGLVPRAKSSPPTPSGSGRAFGRPNEVCIPRDLPGYAIVPSSIQYNLTGDRRCGAWATCDLISRDTAICMSFSLQGHDEALDGGVRFSTGQITADYQLTPRQPQFRKRGD